MNNYAVNRQEWSKLSIFEQMGNIYSEVGRSFKSMEQGDIENQNLAVARALDLFDATAEALNIIKPIRVKEVLRAKDQFLQVFFGNESARSEANIASLEKYFMQYALVARANR